MACCKYILNLLEYQLKMSRTYAPVLAYANPTKPYELHVNAN